MAYSGKKSIDAIFREVRNAVFKTGGGKLLKDGDGKRYLNDDVWVPTGNLSGYDGDKSGFSGSEYDDSGETVKLCYTDGFGTQKDADIKLSRATGEFAGLMPPGDKESLDTIVGNNVTHLKMNKSTVDGKEAYLVDPGNLPSYVDDVVEGYYRSSDGKFYGTAVDVISEPASGVYDTIEKTVSTGGKTAVGVFYRTYSNEITGETGKIYVNLGDSDHKIYRYSGSAYVLISDVPEATLKSIEGLEDSKLDKKTFSSFETGYNTTLQQVNEDIGTAKNMWSGTWAELVALRDNGSLVAGTQYRITDFVTTVGSGVEHVRSAGHQFDVIVTADSTGTLSEAARATLHDEDTYFANSKLEAWRLMYSLDNDTGRFSWADAENGKGVIYRMIDEWDNDLPFDFKNVQFEMYHVDEVLSQDAYMSSTMNSSSLYSSKWWFAGSFYSDPVSVTEDESGNKSYNGTDSNLWGGVVYGSSGTAVTIDSYSGKYSASLGDDKYVTFITSGDRAAIYAYAFSYLSDITSSAPDVADQSLSNMAVRGNAVAAAGNSAAGSDFSLRRLPEVVFWGYACHFNAVGFNNHYISFEENALNNRVGSACESNIIGGYYNSLRDSCRCNILCPNSGYNAIGTGSVGNYLYSMCTNNALGMECRSNVFESQCVYNTLGSSCNDNAFGASCMYNTLLTDCYSNSMQSSCESNLLGNGSSSNEFGTGCRFNTLGADCSGNSFENSNHNTLGSRCQRNKLSMRDNLLGNGCTDNNVYAGGNTLGPGCYNNKLSAAASGNTLGYACQGNSIDGAYNFIGNVNNYNQLGSEANYNRTGDGCSSISIGGNSCYNVFGEGCEGIILATYCNSNVFDNCTSNITINNSAGSSNVIQNYHFKGGITSYSKDSLTGNLAYVTTVAKKSDGTIVTYNEADLYQNS